MIRCRTHLPTKIECHVVYRQDISLKQRNMLRSSIARIRVETVLVIKPICTHTHTKSNLLNHKKKKNHSQILT
jgi:hypothetical protein